MSSFMLFPILFVSLVILLSASSSSHYVRRKKYTKYAACKSFILPNNAEWIKRCYGRRCKGLFVCCEGYELVVKTVCNKRGRWRVKTFCVPITTRASTPSTTTQMSTTQSSTASNTATQSSTAASSTTSSTTAVSSTTPSTSTTTPNTKASSTTTPSTTTPLTTTTQLSLQCDDNPTVENGVITTDVSTEIGSIVQFNCSSGFTLNGRVGSLTCNAMGVFVPDVVCEDCRFQDMTFTQGKHSDTDRQASDEIQCNELCDADIDCVTAVFSPTNRCVFSFLIRRFQTDPGNLELCRQTCFNTNGCEAFIASPADAIEFPCSLFTKPFDSFPSELRITSSCI